jgi:hypothetical protein
MWLACRRCHYFESLELFKIAGIVAYTPAPFDPWLEVNMVEVA